MLSREEKREGEGGHHARAYKSSMKNSREWPRQCNQLPIPFHIHNHPITPLAFNFAVFSSSSFVLSLRLLPGGWRRLFLQAPKHKPIAPLQAHQPTSLKLSNGRLHLVEFRVCVQEIGCSSFLSSFWRMRRRRPTGSNHNSYGSSRGRRNRDERCKVGDGGRQASLRVRSVAVEFDAGGVLCDG